MANGLVRATWRKDATLPAGGRLLPRTQHASACCMAKSKTGGMPHTPSLPLPNALLLPLLLLLCVLAVLLPGTRAVQGSNGACL